MKVSERPDHTLGRSIKVAELMAGEDVPTLPPLRDVVLVATDGRRWTLTGYEEVLSLGAEHPVHYQQSWMLIPAEELDREEELDRHWREAAKNAPPPPEAPRQAKRRHRDSR